MSVQIPNSYAPRYVELLRIQNSPTQLFENTNLVTEVISYAVAYDLVRTKRVLEDIEKAANRFSTWMPILHYSRSENHKRDTGTGRLSGT